MKTYKILEKQVYTHKNYKLIPIRYEDRFDIMKWRNEQIYHLRQNKLLNLNDQDNYFNEIISVLFDQEHPNQILFSFLEKDIFVAYGGLVHINWKDKNAEISFVIDTDLEKNKFEKYWSIFLKLIEEVAFVYMNFHKLFVYAFDLRPNLYKVLEVNNYIKEAVLKEHCFYNKKFIDVIIHSKINC